MLSLRVALRYLFSKKSHRAVNIISAISIAGVAIATMAIVIVLSVFNGFSRLSATQMSKTNPDIKISPVEGKSFAEADSLASILCEVQGVATALSTIEERAMLITDDIQLPVVFKAIPPGYERVISLNDIIIDGVLMQSLDTLSCMQLAVGVANRSGLRPSVMTTADIYVPKRKGRINPANPLTSLKNERMIVSGVFEADQNEIDNDRIIIPLSVGRRLLDYSQGEASAIELAISPDAEVSTIVPEIQALIGEKFIVLDRNNQQAEAFRMIEIEKWVTFMMLCFILVIASFNIISTLSLLVIEKRQDAEIFRALGLGRHKVKDIFAWQGFLITLAGGLMGIVAGIILSLIQENFGLIKLGGDPAALTIDVYPVAVEVRDILVVAIAVIIVGSLTSASTRFFTKNIK